MSFMDEVGKYVNFSVSEVSSRAKEVAAVAKLNASISAREREMEAAYTQIGKLLFERESKDPTSPAAALCAKIAANRESIAEMKARIVTVKEESKEARKTKSEELFGEKSCYHKKDPACHCTCEEVAEECVEAAAETVEAAVEAVAEPVQAVAENLSDFYHKPEENA